MHRWCSDTGRTDVIELGELVAAAVPRAAGGLLLALTGDLAARDPHGTLGRRPPIETGVPRQPAQRRQVRPGRPALRRQHGHQDTGAAALYRVDPDWQVSPPC